MKQVQIIEKILKSNKYARVDMSSCIEEGVDYSNGDDGMTL